MSSISGGAGGSREASVEESDSRGILQHNALSRLKISSRFGPLFISDRKAKTARLIKESRLSQPLPGEGPQEETRALLRRRRSAKLRPTTIRTILSRSSDGSKNWSAFQRLKISGVLQDAEEVSPTTPGSQAFTSRPLDGTREGEDLPLADGLARTIKNWAQRSENMGVLMNEEGVRALVAFASSSSPTVRHDVAIALYRLSEHTKYRAQLIEGGSVAALSSISSKVSGPETLLYCFAALANFAKNPGLEDRIVHDGATPMILQRLSTSREEKLWALGIQSLFNLSCVDAAHGVMDRVIRALLTTHYSVANTHGCNILVLRGICNCASLPQLHLRLVEEGLIPLLLSLATSDDASVDAETLYVASACVGNMVSARGTRSEIVAKGGMKVLAALSKVQEPRTQLVVSGALRNIGMDKPSRFRVLNGSDSIVGSIRAVSLATDPSEVKTLRNCAAALQVMLQYDEGSVAEMVRQGSIELLVMLAGVNDDKSTKQLCASGLCRILTVSQPEAQERMVTEGGIDAVNSLCEVVDDVAIHYQMGKAFYHLSLDTSMHPRLRQSGLLANLVRIATSSSSSHVREVNAAALCGMCNNEANLNSLEAVGGLKVFFALLRDRHSAVQVQCCAALAMLAKFPQCVSELLKLGVVESVVQAFDELRTEDKDLLAGEESPAEDDESPKQRRLWILRSCASIFSRLSAHPLAVQKLKERRFMESIISLAPLDDSGSKRECATALCNLSCDEHVRESMVLAGAVEAVEHLSNSYSEVTQRDCAKCLYNLTSSLSLRQQMLDQGVVQTLLMTCLVRAVGATTKTLCAHTLLNLLSAERMERSLLRSILQAFAILSSEQHSSTLSACARAFFILSSNDDVNEDLVARKARTTSFFSLMRAPELETRLNCGKAACNLLLNERTQRAALLNGGLNVLKILATCGDHTCEVYTAHAIMAVSNDTGCHDVLVREGAANILVLLTQAINDDSVRAAANALCCLSFHPRIRASVIDAGVVSATAVLLAKRPGLTDIHEDCARIICYLAATPSHRPFMANNHAVGALCVLCGKGDGNKVIDALAALALRRLSWNPSCLGAIVDDGGIRLLVEILAGADDVEVDVDMAKDAVYVFSNVSESTAAHRPLIEAGVVETLSRVAALPELRKDANLVWRLVFTIENLSEVAGSHLRMVAAGIVKSLVELSTLANAAACDLVAKTFCNLSRTEAVRETMVSQGCLDVLLSTSRCDRESTRRACTTAVVNLSSYSVIKSGTLETLFKMVTPLSRTPGSTARASWRTKVKVGAVRRLVSSGIFKRAVHGDREALMEGADEMPPGTPTIVRDDSDGDSASSLQYVDDDSQQLVSVEVDESSRLATEEDHNMYYSRLVRGIETPQLTGANDTQHVARAEQNTDAVLYPIQVAPEAMLHFVGATMDSDDFHALLVRYPKDTTIHDIKRTVEESRDTAKGVGADKPKIRQLLSRSAFDLERRRGSDMPADREEERGSRSPGAQEDAKAPQEDTESAARTGREYLHVPETAEPSEGAQRSEALGDGQDDLISGSQMSQSVPVQTLGVATRLRKGNKPKRKRRWRRVRRQQREVSLPFHRTLSRNARRAGYDYKSVTVNQDKVREAMEFRLEEDDTLDLRFILRAHGSGWTQNSVRAQTADVQLRPKTVG